MSTRFADLHLHSHISDGSDAPAEVVRRAAAIGFSAIALTDHDTVAGISEAAVEAMVRGMLLIPGIEISARHEYAELHITGLGINTACPALLETLATFQAGRVTRGQAIVERLQSFGVPIQWESVQQHMGGETAGRLHIARELVALRAVNSMQDAFDRYIGRGRRAYVERPMPSSREAIQLIHDAGGLAFVAHPGISNATMKRLPDLLRLPFDGIEVYHSKHTPGQMTALTFIAQERNLLIAGGSDCHGAAKNARPDMGTVRVPFEQVQRIQDRLASAPEGGGLTLP